MIVNKKQGMAMEPPLELNKMMKSFILAEGAIALSVTLSGGALFAS